MVSGCALAYSAVVIITVCIMLRVHRVAHHEQRLHQLLVLREHQFVGETGIDRAAADGGEVGAEIAGRHQLHLLRG